ncbi:histidine kinase [Psychroflexus sp. MES1-P1E]|uniref:histidine kinase n=1 Tax=Psychroflexus sp. MES1-P1E TaxID=2058320 RepID=UPI000C7D93B6|nr:histidine kinase [Psychroflexus sp. MES1-P1E]PKG41577.1 histidine kinase [Psychroflexus sp. MES1-P1E]
MTNNLNENSDGLKEILDKTLHRFKNNLQTQLSLMNIQSATNRLYFDDRKVIVDRIFALTYLYDVFYRTNKEEALPSDTLISFQFYVLQFLQYLKSSTSEIDFELTGISHLKADVDDLLILAYILVEINDFRMSLNDRMVLDFSHNSKKISLKFSFDSIKNHEKFPDLFEKQFKIFDLLVKQLKGKFDYKKKFVRLSFPIL